jgi:hypothetical protein
MTEAIVTKKLWNKWGRPFIASHNAFIYLFESDFLVWKENGYTTEYEIKLSVNDFRHDFNKKADWKMRPKLKATKITRHEYLYQGHGANRFIYVMPEDVYAKVVDMIPKWAGIVLIKTHQNDIIDMYIERTAHFLHKKTYGNTIRDKMLKAMYWKAWGGATMEYKLINS